MFLNFLENFNANPCFAMLKCRFMKTRHRFRKIECRFGIIKCGFMKITCEVKVEFFRKFDKNFTLGKENKLSWLSLTQYFG